MRILLTGGTGFLGRRLLPLLGERGAEIVLLVRRRPESPVFSAAHIRLVRAEELETAFAAPGGIDAVIHAATDYGRDDPSSLAPFWVNEKLAMQVLQLSLRHRTGLFVNVDSFFSASGQQYRHLQAYSLSKRHFREWGELVAGGKAIAFANLRVFHMYGPEDGSGKFVPDIIRKCLAGSAIALTSGEQRRDFVYVDDVARAIVAVVHAGLAPGYHHYDVGSGSPIRIRDFVERVNRLCGGRAALNFGALAMREGEPATAADTSGLSALGWDAAVDIDTGLKKVIQWISPMS